MSPDEIWLTDFGEPFPGEPAHRRPALLIGPSKLFGDNLPFVIVAPLTTTDRGLSFQVPIEPDHLNRLDEQSFIQCELLRSIGRRRLAVRVPGPAPGDGLERTTSATWPATNPGRSTWRGSGSARSVSSSTWLLHMLAYGLESAPTGFVMECASTARMLGLGEWFQRNSAFAKAVDRLTLFHLALLRRHGRSRCDDLFLGSPGAASCDYMSSRSTHLAWDAQRLGPAASADEHRRRGCTVGAVDGSDDDDVAAVERGLAQWGSTRRCALRRPSGHGIR